MSLEDISQLVDLELHTALTGIGRINSVGVEGPLFVDDIYDRYTWHVTWENGQPYRMTMVLFEPAPDIEGFLLNFNAETWIDGQYVTKPVCNSALLSEQDLPVLMTATLSIGFFIAEMLQI